MYNAAGWCFCSVYLLATVTVTKTVVAGVFVCYVVKWLYFDDILYFHRNFYFFVF